jgi:hypothetical protein
MFLARRSAVWTVMVVFGSGCANHPVPAAWSFDEHIGVVVVAGDRSCFSTKAPAIPANAPLRIVEPSLGQERNALVLAPDATCLHAGEDAASAHGYAIRIEGPAPQTPFFGIGLVGAPSRFRMSEGSMDLDGDQHDEHFRSCTSSEGVHFTIWSEAPLTGRRRWHAYVPLGYDVTPTCAASETAP